MKMIFLSSLFLLVGVISHVRCEPPAPNYLHSQYDDQSYQLNEEVPLSHSHGGHSHSHSGSHNAYDAPPSRGGDHEVVVQEYHHPIPDAPTKVIQHGHAELDSSSYRAPSSSSSYSKRRPVYHSPSHSHGHSHGHGPSPSYSHSRPKQLSSLSSYELPSKAEYSVRETSEGLSSPGYSTYKQNDYKGYASSGLAPAGSGDDYGVDAYSPSHSGDYGSPNTYQNSPIKSGGLSYSSSSSPSYGSAPVSHSPGYSSYSESEYDQAPVYRPTKSKTYRSPALSHSHSSSYASASAAPYTSYGIPAKTATYGSPKGSSLLSSYGSPKLTYSKPVYAPPKSVYASPTYSKGLHTSYRSPSSYYRSQKTSSYRSPVTSSYGAPSSKGFGYSYTPTDKGYVRFAEESNGEQKGDLAVDRKLKKEADFFV